MADGYVEITSDTLKTENGINELNRMLKFLHDSIAGDGVNQKVYNGVGSPEGVIVADRGSIYMRLDGGASTCMYVKESGSSSTGWVAK